MEILEMQDVLLVAWMVSKFLEVADDVSCVPFTLRGGNAAIGVLLKFAGKETLVEDFERHLTVIRLLMHPLQLFLQFLDPLSLLLGLHGSHINFLILSGNICLLPSPFGPGLE